MSLPADLAGESTRCHYALHVLAGEIGLEQAGRNCLARIGDIVTFDGALPARMSTGSESLHDIVALAIPAERLQTLPNLGRHSGSLRLLRAKTAGLLTGCLGLVAEHMSTGSKQELEPLQAACVALLDVAVSHLDQIETPRPENAADNAILRNILDYTNRNLADGALCPPEVAQRFGISVRYLHKLFAASGVTFSAYVAMRRLDHVRSELIASAAEPQSIAALAFKWGFQDISTFNKAFRKRFGCAPRQLRSRSGC
jgi:AraC-like DNA-binding protein